MWPNSKIFFGQECQLVRARKFCGSYSCSRVCPDSSLSDPSQRTHAHTSTPTQKLLPDNESTIDNFDFLTHARTRTLKSRLRRARFPATATPPSTSTHRKRSTIVVFCFLPLSSPVDPLPRNHPLPQPPTLHLRSSKLQPTRPTLCRRVFNQRRVTTVGQQQRRELT